MKHTLHPTRWAQGQHSREGRNPNVCVCECVSLLCVYSVTNTNTPAHSQPVDTVCGLHTAKLPLNVCRTRAACTSSQLHLALLVLRIKHILCRLWDHLCVRRCFLNKVKVRLFIHDLSLKTRETLRCSKLPELATNKASTKLRPCVFVCVPVCLCLTCSDKELLYFFDMRFLMVSLTDLTFFPSEIRDVVGDLTTSLYIASCSLFCGLRKAGQKRMHREDGNDRDERRRGGISRDWRGEDKGQGRKRGHKNKAENRRERGI